MFLIQFIIPQFFDGTAVIQQIMNHEFGISGLPLLLMITFIVFAMAVFVGWLFYDSDGVLWAGMNDVTTIHGDGTAENPVNVDAEEDVNNNTNNNHGLSNIWESIRSSMQNFSPHYLILVSAFILPLSMVIPILLGGDSTIGSSTWSVAVTVLAIVAHACMAMAAYGVLREVVSGATPFPGNRRGRPSRYKYTVGEIADLVRKIPVEEFVSEEDIKNGECSISRMKRILVHRGASEVVDRCLERDDLIKEICRVRIYDSECTICSEEYLDGDALRVLPCQHEYHLHCFDRWMYTFAADSRATTEPSCPLCKYKLR